MRGILILLVIVLIIGSFFTTVRASDTLIAHWSFDDYQEISFDNRYHDVTGNGNDARAGSIKLADGISGKALDLSTETPDITIPNARTQFNLAQFSAEAWVYADKNVYNWHFDSEEYLSIFKFCAVGMKGQAVKAGWGFDISDRGGIIFGIADSGKNSTFNPRWISLETNRVLIPKYWYQVALTFDGVRMSIYLNGTLEADMEVPNIRYIPLQDDARIGSTSRWIDTINQSPVVTNRFKGKIDELKVYGNALSAETVAAHFRQYPVAEFKGLLMHLPFAKNEMVPVMLGGEPDTFFRMMDVTGHSFPVVNYKYPLTLGSGITDSALYLDTNTTCCFIENTLRNFDIPRFTLSCWVRGDSGMGQTGGRATILSNQRIDSVTGASRGFSLTVDSSGFFEFGMADSMAHWHTCTGQTMVSPYSWFNITAVYDADSMYLYIGGNRERSIAQSAGHGHSLDSLWLGWRYIRTFEQDGSLWLDVVEPYSGLIDELKMYNYALTPDEVSAAFGELYRPSPKTNLGIKRIVAAPGTEIVVPICCSNRAETPITALSFDVDYDPAVLEFKNFSCENAFKSGWTGLCNKNVMTFPSGKVSFSTEGSIDSLRYGEGELFSMIFKVAAATAPGTVTPLNFSKISLNGSTDNKFSRVQPGRITVSENRVLAGDINTDGAVTADDAHALLRHLVGVPAGAGLNTTNEIADVNGNGVVSAGDAAELLQFSMALLPEFSGLSEMSDDSHKSPARTMARRLQLIKTGTTVTETTWSLSGAGLAGLCAAEFTIACTPSSNENVKATVSATLPGTYIESRFDPATGKLRIAFITNDFINRNDAVELLRIKTPPAGSGGAGDINFYFERAVLNDGAIPTGLEASAIRRVKLNKLPLRKPHITIANASLVVNRSGDGPADVRIYTANGRIVFRQTIDRSVASISLKHLSRGMYLYSVKEHGVVMHGRVVVGR